MAIGQYEPSCSTGASRSRLRRYPRSRKSWPKSFSRGHTSWQEEQASPVLRAKAGTASETGEKRPIPKNTAQNVAVPTSDRKIVRLIAPPPGGVIDARLLATRHHLSKQGRRDLVENCESLSKRGDQGGVGEEAIDLFGLRRFVPAADPPLPVDQHDGVLAGKERRRPGGNG